MTEEELRELKEQLGGRSFIAESEFIRKSKKYLKERLKDESVREVLVAPYPDPCLSALVSYYEGFIFERGGLLSHLAIILREQNKPAVIHRGISGYADGADVEMIQGKVNIY
ncbi:MAG: PEP-utilizing enzyme [Clostridiales bacterium]|nr:PEP-utilizing enzyme [Clostridiales bacterium]